MNIDSLIIGFKRLETNLTDKSSKKYLKFGFLQRALQIKDTRNQLSQIIEKAGGESLGGYEVVEVNIFLNSFYINIMGALDNLAWVIQHELSVIEGANENNKCYLINLFNREFQKRLNGIDDNIVESLIAHHEWYKEIKKFRDPSAHRIPLYCPPGVVNQEYYEKLESKKLSSKNKEPRSLMNEYYELAHNSRFEPIFVSFSEFTNDTPYHLIRTIEQDYHPFWKVAKIVLGLLNNRI